MAAVLHDTGCARDVPVGGYGGLPDCTCNSGRFEERSSISHPGPGIILSIFRTTDGLVRFVVERTADGRLGIFTAGQLGVRDHFRG